MILEKLSNRVSPKKSIYRFTWKVNFHRLEIFPTPMLGAKCTMINKNSETNVEVHPEDQKSKIARHWLLSQPQSEMVILSLVISE